MTAQPRFVLGCTYVPPSQLTSIAMHAEACGFDVLSVSDHVVVPERTASPYPYSRSGEPPFEDDDAWSDPWVAIGAMAAVTSRLRFMTNVFVLPLRDPFTVAKAVGTAARLSGGRVSLGVGVGWMREEFELIGRAFSDRGQRTDEMIDVLRALWRPGPARFQGRFYSFDRVRMSPAPLARIPILVGGESERARERAARLGDGYVSTAHRAATLGDLAADLRARRERLGRSEEAFDFVGVPTDLAGPSDYLELATSGVSGVVVVPWGARAGKDDPVEQKLVAMSQFAEETIAPVRRQDTPVGREPS